MGVASPKQLLEGFAAQANQLLTQLSPAENTNEPVPGTEFIHAARKLYRELPNACGLEQEKFLATDIAKCVAVFKDSRKIALDEECWATDPAEHAYLKKGLELTMTTLEHALVGLRVREEWVALDAKRSQSTTTTTTTTTTTANPPTPTPTPTAEAKDVPQAEEKYEFAPLLHFSRSGSLSFRGSLNPLIQKLPKALGVVDAPSIVDAETWIHSIASAIKQNQEPTSSASEQIQALNRLIPQQEIDRETNLQDGFKSADVGEKLSKLLDDDNLLKDLCLARVEHAGLKSSSIGRVQKAIQNAKEEMPSVKMKNAQTFKAKLVNTFKGSKEERRGNHQAIFDAVALEVRKSLLGEHEANADISQADINRLFKNKYQELVKNENPTPEECKKLFKFALKCYAVGIFPDDQSVAGGGNRGVAENLPQGTNFLTALLKAQKLLEKKPVMGFLRGALGHVVDENGKPKYRAPSDDECREFVDFLKEGFGCSGEINHPSNQPSFHSYCMQTMSATLTDIFRENKNINAKQGEKIKRLLVEGFDPVVRTREKEDVGGSKNWQRVIQDYLTNFSEKYSIDCKSVGYEELLEAVERHVSNGGNKEVQQKYTLRNELENNNLSEPTRALIKKEVEQYLEEFFRKNKHFHK